MVNIRNLEGWMYSFSPQATNNKRGKNEQEKNYAHC